MANAHDVLQQLTNTWSSMLDKFYDSVADEYIKWMAKEYNMDIKELREKAIPLKAKLLSKATDAVSVVKTTKKQNLQQKVVDTSKYGSMSRKELIELCKLNNIPVKRKNQDMIDKLKLLEENKSEHLLAKEEDDNTSSDQEPELPKVVKKEMKKPTKHQKSSSSTKNELFEETLNSESDDED